MGALTGELEVAVYYLTLAAVVALSAAKGGRFERQMALVMLLASVATLASQMLLKQFVPILPLTCIDLLVFTAFFRIWRYLSRAWTGFALLLQLGSLCVDMAYAANIGMSPLTYLNLLNILYYAILGTIVFSVIHRRIGPPVPLRRARCASSSRVAPRPSIIHFWLHKR